MEIDSGYHYQQRRQKVLNIVQNVENPPEDAGKRKRRIPWKTNSPEA